MVETLLNQTPRNHPLAGYQIIFKNGKWSQVFGSAAKKKSFAREDRRGHRSEVRGTGKLRRARVRGEGHPH